MDRARCATAAPPPSPPPARGARRPRRRRAGRGASAHRPAAAARRRFTVARASAAPAVATAAHPALPTRPVWHVPGRPPTRTRRAPAGRPGRAGQAGRAGRADPGFERPHQPPARAEAIAACSDATASAARCRSISAWPWFSSTSAGGGAPGWRCACLDSCGSTTRNARSGAPAINSVRPTRLRSALRSRLRWRCGGAAVALLWRCGPDPGHRTAPAPPQSHAACLRCGPAVPQQTRCARGS